LTLGALPGDLSIQPRLTLTANNSYAGGTISSFGTLVVSGLGDLGPGDVFVDGTTTLTVGATTYTANGRLELQTSNAIDDLARLILTGTDLPLGSRGGPNQGGFLVLGPGVNEIVGSLDLGGTLQAPGTYGSTESLAAFRDDEYFFGSGIVTVVPEPGAAAMLIGGSSVLSGFKRRRGSWGVERGGRRD
jgi:hypothetical protein